MKFLSCHGLLLFVASTLAATALLAQTLPRTFPDLGQRGYMHTFPRNQMVTRTSYVGGREYICLFSESDVHVEWQPPAPSSLSFEKAEEVARTELRKLGEDESRWLVAEFQISRFGRSQNWYNTITLIRDLEFAGVRPETFTLLMDSSGKPGQVRRLAPSGK